MINPDLVESSNAPGFSGVCARFGENFRVIVAPSGVLYRVQRRGVCAGVEVWSGPWKARCLARLLQLYADRLPGLADACAGLPDDPALARPDTVAVRASQSERFRQTDWRRADYGRVLCCVGRYRLAVDADGGRYLIQCLPPSLDLSFGPWHQWALLFKPARLDNVRKRLRWLHFDAGDLSKVGFDELWFACLELPARACDGVWPSLGARPVTLRQQAGKRRERRW